MPGIRDKRYGLRSDEKYSCPYQEQTLKIMDTKALTPHFDLKIGSPILSTSHFFNLPLDHQQSYTRSSSNAPIGLLNHTWAVKQVIFVPSSVKTSASTVYLPGGICFGKSTSFVNVVSPFSRGHFRSTFLTCSQRSASWLMRVIRPYLTWMWTLAPGSTRSWRVPIAVIVRVVPLKSYKSVLVRTKLFLERTTCAVFV